VVGRAGERPAKATSPASCLRCAIAPRWSTFACLAYTYSQKRTQHPCAGDCLQALAVSVSMVRLGEACRARVWAVLRDACHIGEHSGGKPMARMIHCSLARQAESAPCEGLGDGGMVALQARDAVAGGGATLPLFKLMIINLICL
jgi:hypothetical protein